MKPAEDKNFLVILCLRYTSLNIVTRCNIFNGLRLYFSIEAPSDAALEGEGDDENLILWSLSSSYQFFKKWVSIFCTLNSF